jgi:hypothetical protein
VGGVWLLPSYVTSEEFLMVCGRRGLVVFSSRELWFITVLEKQNSLYNAQWPQLGYIWLGGSWGVGVQVGSPCPLGILQ